MSIFSSPVNTGWSNQYAHGGLIQFASRGSILDPNHHHVKSGTTAADTIISANSHSLRMPLAAIVCSSLLPIQACAWNDQIPSITAAARAGSIPIVGNFIIDQRISRTQPQSCMRALLRAQWSAQWNPVQWKHIGSITTPSSMGPLCTQVCSYPTRDSDRAVCYSLATSLLEPSVLSSNSLSSPMWIQPIKSSVGSSA